MSSLKLDKVADHIVSGIIIIVILFSICGNPFEKPRTTAYECERLFSENQEALLSCLNQ